MDENNQIIIYQSEDGETRIEVKFTGEDVHTYYHYRAQSCLNSVP